MVKARLSVLKTLLLKARGLWGEGAYPVVRLFESKPRLDFTNWLFGFTNYSL